MKKQLFFVNYSITDYERASQDIIDKALTHSEYCVSALAVHGLIESVRNKSFRDCVTKIDLVVPDGTPVKWALNSFYSVGLKDRVAGPILTKHVLAKANKLGLSVFLYGSTLLTLGKLQSYLKTNYPNIRISGIHADRFREATPEEDAEDVRKINESGTHIVLVGRGCPRQEKWVADHTEAIQAPLMAIGAAFDFLAGNIKHAPLWMQNWGLEWFYRLIQDPRKLWKRYLITNAYFVILFISCKLHLYKVAF